MLLLISNFSNLSLKKRLEYILSEDEFHIFNIKDSSGISTAEEELQKSSESSNGDILRLFLLETVAKDKGDWETIAFADQLFQKIKTDERKKYFLKVYPVFIFENDENLKEWGRNNLRHDVGLDFFSPFIILDYSKDKSGNKVPHSVLERESLVLNLVLMVKFGEDFVGRLDVNRDLFSYAAKSKLFLKDYIAQNKFNETVKNYLAELFKTRIETHEIDHDLYLQHQESISYDQLRKVFIYDHKIKFPMGKNAWEEYKSRIAKDLRYKFANLYKESELSDSITENQENIRQHIKKIDDFSFFKKGIESWIKQLSKKIKNLPSLDALFEELRNRIIDEFLLKLKNENIRIRKIFRSRILTGLFLIFLGFVSSVFWLKYQFFSFAIWILIAAILLSILTIYYLLSIRDIKKINEYLKEGLNPIFKTANQKRKNKIREIMIREYVRFLDIFHNTVKNLHLIIEKEISEKIIPIESRYLELVKPFYDESLFTQIKESLIGDIKIFTYRSWQVNEEEFKDFYFPLKENSIKKISKIVEEHGTEYLSEHFNNENNIINFFNEFPLDLCPRGLDDLDKQTKSILFFSGDLILPADRINFECENQVIARPKSLVISHFCGYSLAKEKG